VAVAPREFVPWTEREAHSQLIPFSEIVARPIRWAWQDRIALKKMTALAGRPKIGKGPGSTAC
jgi:hypothetical protein